MLLSGSLEVRASAMHFQACMQVLHMTAKLSPHEFLYSLRNAKFEDDAFMIWIGE